MDFLRFAGLRLLGATCGSRSSVAGPHRFRQLPTEQRGQATHRGLHRDQKTPLNTSGVEHVLRGIAVGKKKDDGYSFGAWQPGRPAALIAERVREARWRRGARLSAATLQAVRRPGDAHPCGLP